MFVVLVVVIVVVFCRKASNVMSLAPQDFVVMIRSCWRCTSDVSQLREVSK